MKIAVYGATGNVGSRIVAEAVRRGHVVTALSRNPGDVTAGIEWRHGDLADTGDVSSVAAAHDAIVTANGPSRVPGEDPNAFVGLMRSVAGAVGSTRLVVVGGAGSLEASPGVRLFDLPEFPDAYKPEALASAGVLAFLRASDEALNWTYLSPAPEIGPGERTGSYRTELDVPAGSWISYEDYAVALVDELENPTHQRARFTVATK